MAARKRQPPKPRPEPMTAHTETTEPEPETFAGTPDESTADDGVLHDLGEMSPGEAAELSPFKGDPDPGAGQARPEP